MTRELSYWQTINHFENEINFIEKYKKGTTEFVIIQTKIQFVNSLLISILTISGGFEWILISVSVVSLYR
jgi:hypothetical protein